MLFCTPQIIRPTYGKFLVPVANATPFLMLMGQVVTGWLLLWQAGVAKEKLNAPDGDGADKPFALFRRDP